MKKVLFITNIPAPYRIDFYNELGKSVDLTVLFEAKGASDQGIRFNWNLDCISNFKAVFLSEGDIKERRIDWKIFKFLRKNLYDEIVVTNYSYFTEMAAIIYLKMHRIPYYMETDGGIIRNENALKRRYKRFLVSGAKGYFSPGNKSDEYLEFYGAPKSLISRYPFTSIWKKDIISQPLSKKEKQEKRKELKLSERNMVLGVGQFIHRKGWDILIKAASKINADIYIIGGIETQEYKQLIEDNHVDNVYFKGFLSKDEISLYMQAADLFVLPTREDIWGLVVNEALACGLPVVTTTRCVSGCELIENGKNGYLIAAENCGELQKAVNTVLDNENEMRFAKNALSMIQDYTIENMADAHIRVWRKGFNVN